MLSIFLFFFLALLRRLFPTAFDFWCKHAIRHCFQSTFFTTNGSESVLPPLAVVFCAAMKEGSSRVSSLALLNPGFGIYGRRSQTVQGLVMLFLAATWFPLRDAYRMTARGPHKREWWTFSVPEILERIPVLKPNSDQRCGLNSGFGSSSGFNSECYLNGLWETAPFSRPDLNRDLDPLPSWVVLFLLGPDLNPIRYFISLCIRTPLGRVGSRPSLDLLSYWVDLFLFMLGCPYDRSDRDSATSWTASSYWAPRPTSFLGDNLGDYLLPGPLYSQTRPGLSDFSLTSFMRTQIGLYASFGLTPCRPGLHGSPCSSSQTWHFLRIPAYLRNLLIGIEHMLSPFISLYLEAILSASFCCVMDPELMSALENLQFTEEEATAVVAESPIEDGDSSSWLVRSVITRKPVNGDSVVRIFRSVWKAKNILDIVELRPNFFLIKPSTLDAKDMILKRRPWASHDEFFSIMSYNPAWRIEEYDFQLMTIWIRVYRLPLRAMTRDMGIRLGGCVGKVLGVDHRVEGGNMGDFLRILVQVDIRKPLRRCVLLGDSAGKEASPRPLCYERLPEFCYFCGLVGHSLSSCTAKPADLDARKLQYGSWLRVPPSVNRDARPPASQDERPVANQDARPTATEATTDLPTAQATAKVSHETSSDSPSATVSVTVHADVPHVSASPEIVAGVQQPLPPPIFASSNVNAGTERVLPAPLSASSEFNAGFEQALPAVCASGQAYEFGQANEDVVLPLSQAAKEPGLSLSISAVEVKHSEGSKDAGSGLPLSIPAAVCNPVGAKRSLQGKYELWRFLVSPDSLVARVFRAKYFRSGSLLDVGLPDHASYAWKGLYSTLQEFRGGFQPLSDSRPTRYRWSGHDTGIFSVRSGYFYLCRSLSFCRPSPLWKALKSLPTLPKVRIFAWRLAHDCLPAGRRIAAAGLGPGLCPFCSTIVETSLHAFRDCPSAAEALHLGGFPISVTDSRADSIFCWLFVAARSLSRGDFSKLVLIL
ncbi:hypothetical protein V6N11_056295 [Hibiscus sabdariffa]|uniref:Reverse transcriptase zinc-binding domain-containing protein n=1 Tax=Hibiscus sabdariffa TaxID=183260 RepID=A0ABR2T3C8_9ROSI